MTRITSSHRELLLHVLAAMGMGSSIVTGAACGGNTTDPRASDAAVTPKADAASDVSAEATVDAEAPVDNRIVMDFGGIVIPPIDVDAGIHCRKLVTERTRPAMACADGTAITDAGWNPRGFQVRACLPAPPAGQSCDDIYNESCKYNTFNCGLAQYGSKLLCADRGPAGECCYTVEGSCPVGRPFLVEGKARRASIGSDASWAQRRESSSHDDASPLPDVAALDPETRAALADLWTQDALAEHASIASFSRFVLQCLAVGAPADITFGAQRACADEIEHAQIAFRLASAYADRTIGPGKLDVVGALDQGLDPTDIACSVASEGCIAELVSANFVAAARDRATDPAMRAILSRIAEQEMNHALLAWRYLAWACENGDAPLRVRLARVFERMNEHVGFGATTDLPANEGALRAHGYLSVDERRIIARSVLEQVVRPAARALLAAAREGKFDPRHVA